MSLTSLNAIKPFVINPYKHDSQLSVDVTGYKSDDGNFFAFEGGVVDFFCKKNITPILSRALENWGSSLHQVNNVDTPPESYHYEQIAEFIPDFPFKLSKEIFVDIGCGAGFDVRKLALNNHLATCLALDVGEHVYRNARRDKHINNLHYIRANALMLPISSEVADYVVSYGVFHHTSDPQKCISEAFRILKKNRNGYFYLYTDQSQNIFKKVGIKLENLLMKLTSRLSIQSGRWLCWALSPIILLIFSWPAQFFKKLFPKKRFGHSFPLHWGTTPASIVDDLQDRLMSPINYRFNKKQLVEKFKIAGFKEVCVESTTYGHYIKVTK